MLGLLAAGTLAAAGLAGPAPSPTAVQTADSAFVLPGGTAVPLALADEVSSRTHGQGDRVALVVTEDLMVGGRVAIPKGAPALAEIARHRATGPFGKSGMIELRLLHVDLNGRPIRLDGVRGHGGKSNVRPAIAAGVVVGAVVGAVIKGKHALLPPGTRLTGYVHRDVRLEAAD